MEDGRLSLLGGRAITLSIKNHSLLAAAMGVSFLLASCSLGNNADALASVALALRKQRSYKAPYTVLTRIEGAARPIVAEGVLEFRFPDRSRLTSGDLETISIGPQVWVRVEGGWQRDELVSPPLEPDLYLAAVMEAKKMEGAKYAFRLSVYAYRIELQRRMGTLPEQLVDRLKAFAAEGEVLIGEDGLPKEMTIRVKDEAAGQRLEITEATFRFVEFGRVPNIEPPKAESP